MGTPEFEEAVVDLALSMVVYAAGPGYQDYLAARTSGHK